MNASVTFPVQVLREHITALEAAISVCLADPDHKPVHKLRTETRRVEALLLLLGLVPGLPEHRKEAAALLRALGKLRRAAGNVRDLDVHRKMLEDFAQTEDKLVESAPENSDPDAAPKRGRKRSSEATAEESPDNASLLSKAATDLRKRMGKERDKAAADLQDLLKARQRKTARASEALLEVLKPAEELALPGTDLLRNAESVLTRDGVLRNGDIAELDEEQLHSVRKAAKAARYVAESLPDDAALVAAAERFETLQEAGGQWHDALQLARAARRYFGKGHELTAAYREERDRKLEAYRSALSSVSGPEEKPGRRKPARATRANGRKAAKAA